MHSTLRRGGIFGTSHFYTYNKGTELWDKKGDEDEDALRHIIMSHRASLGEKYGMSTNGADRIVKLCKSKNPVTEEFYNKLDTQYVMGEMAFTDGIYNILTKQLRLFKPSDYVTMHNN
jgi:hypothetical protein